MCDESKAQTATAEPVVDRQLVVEMVARAQADGVSSLDQRGHHLLVHRRA